MTFAKNRLLPYSSSPNTPRGALQRLCTDWPVLVSFQHLIWPDHRRGKLPPIVLFAGAMLLSFGLLWLEVFARDPFGLFALIVLTVVAGVVDHLSPQLSRPSGVSAQDSWNAPRPFNTKMLLTAPLHSDHFLNPTRSYVELSYVADHTRLP